MVRTVTDIGLEPVIRIAQTSSDLEMRGSERETITIDTPVEVDYQTEGSGMFIEHVPDSATIRLPQNGRVILGGVSGNVLGKYIEGGFEVDDMVEGETFLKYCGPTRLAHAKGQIHLKYINGPTTIDQAEGGLVAKYIQAMTLNKVEGALQMAYVEGDIQIDTIEGDATIRDVSGSITIGDVHGSLSLRDVPMTTQVGTVRGSLALRTHFKAETTHRFTVEGSVRIRVPDNANVRIVMPVDTQLSTELESVERDEHREVVLGNGSATVYLHVSGSVSITQQSGYEVEEELIELLDDELGEQLANLSVQLGERMSSLNVVLGEVSGNIRRRIERKLEIARQRVDEAARQVEEVAETASHEERGHAAVKINPDVLAREPVSEDERMAVLHMLENGKISVEEAEKLLAALEGA